MVATREVSSNGLGLSLRGGQRRRKPVAQGRRNLENSTTINKSRFGFMREVNFGITPPRYCEIYIAHNELNINYFVDARKRFAPIGLVSWHFSGPDCIPSTKLFSQSEFKMFGRRRYCSVVGLCTSDKQPIPLKSIKNRYMICIYHLIFWPTIVWFCGYLYPLSKINPYKLRTRNSITSCPILSSSKV